MHCVTLGCSLYRQDVVVSCNGVLQHQCPAHEVHFSWQALLVYKVLLVYSRHAVQCHWVCHGVPPTHLGQGLPKLIQQTSQL